MEPKKRDFGLLLAVSGLCFVLLGLLLFGVTSPDGVDWVSIVTAVAGFGMLIAGLYSAFRHKGTGSTV